ncbi:MAG: hypothetical protein IPO15_16140 [Anaerolineae bacterium]|nr:hypothetical protein [Anaerolineae bacterium]
MAASVADVSTGNTHACTPVTTNGGVKCWGRNEYGQLGDGDDYPAPDARSMGGAEQRHGRERRMFSYVALTMDGGSQITGHQLQRPGWGRHAGES